MIKNITQTLAFLFFITISITYSQSDYMSHLIQNKNQQNYPCKRGVKKAEKDAKNKVYPFITYGLTIHNDLKFHKFYVKYMSSKYGISIIEGSCVFSVVEECYSKRMKEIIYKKFGKNIFKKGKQDAKKLYKNEVNKTTLDKA